MKFMIQRFTDVIVALSKRTPYTHLWHVDGSLYMARYWLMPRFLMQRISEDYPEGFETNVHWKPKPWVPFSLRLHRIATPDFDPHMHDHPWSFLSLVLRGGYMERRPVHVEPSFVTTDEREDYKPTYRGVGSIALRRSTDRHLISFVEKDTWTLVALGPKRHWWGFFTPAGKVHWKEYPSVHNYLARTERP